MKLSHFDPDLFLRDSWQKQPLLIRNPWDNWENPLEPDELARLLADDAAWAASRSLYNAAVEAHGYAWLDTPAGLALGADRNALAKVMIDHARRHRCLYSAFFAALADHARANSNRVRVDSNHARAVETT